MANTLVESFRIKDIRRKVFFTIGLLIITRIGAYIPIPGINPSAVMNYFESNANAFTDYLNFFSGGAFANFSIFMLGVMPYISTQIILQLLMVVVPQLKRLAEDPQGTKKIQQYTRWGTIVVCAVQALAASVYARSIPGALAIPTGWFIAIAIISVTAGSMLEVWIGERITQFGIGNGISLLIFAGIVARFPNAIITLIQGVISRTVNPLALVALVIMFLFVVALVVYEEKGQRKITVIYANRQVGNKMYRGQNTFFPIKINPSGVIPVIFASTLLSFPLQLGYNSNIGWLQAVANFLNPTGWPYLTIYSVLILCFAFFYTSLVLRPDEIAENIRSNGGTVPGIGTGYKKDPKTHNIVYSKETGKPVSVLEDYLRKVINRIAFPGALFLVFIALVPTLVQLAFRLPQTVAMLFGGTSLIIMVGVALETVSQLEAELGQHNITKDYKSRKKRTNKI